MEQQASVKLAIDNKSIFDMENMDCNMHSCMEFLNAAVTCLNANLQGDLNVSKASKIQNKRLHHRQVFNVYSFFHKCKGLALFQNHRTIICDLIHP